MCGTTTALQREWAKEKQKQNLEEEESEWQRERPKLRRSVLLKRDMQDPRQDELVENMQDPRQYREARDRRREWQGRLQ